MGSEARQADEFRATVGMIRYLAEAMMDIRSSALSPNAGGSKWYSKLDQIRTHAEELLKAYDDEDTK